MEPENPYQRHIVKSTWTFDLDADSSDRYDKDFQWRAHTSTSWSISPSYGYKHTVFSGKNFDDISINDIRQKESQMNDNLIYHTQLAVNDILLFKTNSGNFGKLKIKDFPPNQIYSHMIDLEILFKVYPEIVIGGNYGRISSWNGSNIIGRRTFSDFNMQFFEVVHGKNNYIGIGNQAVARSLNKRNWSYLSLPVAHDTGYGYFRGVTFGEDKFVVVGDYNIVLVTSDNGINWELRRVGKENYLMDVTYAMGYFWAVEWGGKIYKSDDGLNWSYTGRSNVAKPLEIKFVNNRLFVVGGGYSIDSSTDGETWINHFVMNTDYGWNSIEFNEDTGSYILVGGAYISLFDKDFNS